MWVLKGIAPIALTRAFGVYIERQLIREIEESGNMGFFRAISRMTNTIRILRIFPSWNVLGLGLPELCPMSPLYVLM